MIKKLFIFASGVCTGLAFGVTLVLAVVELEEQRIREARAYRRAKTV